MALLLLILTMVAITVYAKSQGQEFDDLGDLMQHDENYPGYVIEFAQAISFAEGFGVAGSIPSMRNNPGDIVSNGEIVSFPSLQDGWNALYRQVERMFENTSRYYNSSMSIREVASKYTATEQDAWARNVSFKLNGSVGFEVTPDTTLDQLAGG